MIPSECESILTKISHGGRDIILRVKPHALRRPTSVHWLGDHWYTVQTLTPIGVFWLQVTWFYRGDLIYRGGLEWSPILLCQCTQYYRGVLIQEKVSQVASSECTTLGLGLGLGRGVFLSGGSSACSYSVLTITVLTITSYTLNRCPVSSLSYHCPNYHCPILSMLSCAVVSLSCAFNCAITVLTITVLCCPVYMYCPNPVLCLVLTRRK